MAYQDAFEYVTVNNGILFTESKNAFEYVTVNTQVANPNYDPGTSTPGFDVTDKPVFSLGVESSSAAFSANDFGYDFAIGGHAFLNGISAKTPYRRGLADIRKQQFDASANPGEQSLDGYWLRSQQDFTGGAGITFMEPSNDEFQMKRFVSSVGVDVWTRGQLKLLRSAGASVAVTNSKPNVVSVNHNGNPYFVIADGSTVRSAYTVDAAITGWGSTPNGNITSTGDGVVVCTTTGMEYLAAPFTGSKVVLATSATTTTCNAWWVKQRFIIADSHHLFEKGGITGSTNLNTSGKLYSHPLTTWKWTSVVETPDAILAAGYAGNKSAIYKFTLSSAITTAELPPLTSAITAAELPYGEVVTGMFSYLGSYVVIGTNRGVRVAEVDGNGNLAYGPLSFTSTDKVDITGFAGVDRFVYAGVGSELDGNAGLIRIDLSSTDGAGRYAWATDLSAGSPGVVTSIAVINDSADSEQPDRIGFVNSADFFYEQSGTSFVPSGYLVTGQVRYNTLEPKNFRYFRLRGETNGGTVKVSSVLYNQNPQPLFTFSDGISIDQDITIAIPTNPQQESLGLKITLDRGSTVQTPTVTGWQLKAVPGSNRRILVKIPLLCFDHETDNAGTARGYDGYAYNRLVDLQSHCTTGAIVVFRDLRTGEQFSATIEDVSFTQEVANTQNKVDNFGGIIELTVQQV